MQSQEKANLPTMERQQNTGTTAWKIRIANEDLYLLKWIAEKFAEQDGGLFPKPTVTDLLHKAIEHYIEEALAALPKLHRGHAAHASPGKLSPFGPPSKPADRMGTPKPS